MDAKFAKLAPHLDECRGACPLDLMPLETWSLASQLIEAGLLLQVGILPAAGGLQDQAATFVQGVRIVGGVKEGVEADGAGQ